ncbi:hypothetical protein K32_05000 [Kaistia sp. 32K]|nr:hypothetical protein K32_05000 [Kaistia sp. 32K]
MDAGSLGHRAERDIRRRRCRPPAEGQRGKEGAGAQKLAARWLQRVTQRYSGSGLFNLLSYIDNRQVDAMALSGGAGTRPPGRDVGV